jgi:hypothetical protein
MKAEGAGNFSGERVTNFFVAKEHQERKRRNGQ